MLNGMLKASLLIIQVSYFKWMIVTILYLSLSSRTGNLKCGRFIDTVRRDGNQERGVRDRDSPWLFYDEKDEKSVDRMKKTSSGSAIGNATSLSWFMISRPDSRRCRSGYGRAYVRNDIRQDLKRNVDTRRERRSLRASTASLRGSNKNITGLRHIEHLLLNMKN